MKKLLTVLFALVLLAGAACTDPAPDKGSTTPPPAKPGG